MEKVADKKERTIYDPRFERKFVFEGVYLQDLIDQIVLVHSFGFHEIYTRRSVNNVYFDDAAYTFYHQNVAGDTDRKKYRLRWYGDDMNIIEKPRLEIKKKFGEIGDKYVANLANTSFDLLEQGPEVIRSQIIDTLDAEGHALFALDMKRLLPALINTYQRRYFLSSCGNFRITLDYDMRFYNPAWKSYPLSEIILENNATILELKYKPEHDTEARQLTQEWTNRMSKNSKYVTGIDCISR